MNDQVQQQRVIPVVNSDLLKTIPEYNGNPVGLVRFIKTVEQISETYYDTRKINCPQNILIINTIFSKLTGAASEAVNIYNASNWPEIKATLLQNFGDQRDLNTLIQNLMALRQNNETPQQFYSSCIHMLNTICNYVDLHSNNEIECVSYRDLFTKQTLRVFLTGLRDPLSSRIRARNPDSLPQALTIMNDEINIANLQNPRNNFNKPLHNPVRNKSYSNFDSPRFIQPQQQTYRFNSPPQTQYRQTFPSQPIPYRPVNNTPPQRFPTNNDVFGRPNIKNVWKNPPKNNFRPTPMSGVTNMSAKPRPTPMSGITSTPFKPQPSKPNYFQPSSSRNFVSEELFNTEQNSYYPNYQFEDNPEYFQNPEYPDIDNDEGAIGYDYNFDYTNTNENVEQDVSENFTEACLITENT